MAAGIQRVKGAKRLGVRIGNWLTIEQAKGLLQEQPCEGLRAKRDRAILAILIGCGLRRAELVGLKAQDFQIREEHWVIADLIGKGKHIRTVPVPVWVKRALDCWTAAAEITGGTIFRRVNRMGKLWGSGITPKAIWHVVKAAATRAGISKFAPHDLRRSLRPVLSLKRRGAGANPISARPRTVQTTERYLGCKQKLRHAVNDNLRLEDSRPSLSNNPTSGPWPQMMDPP